jgi:ribose 5-phosphate isomerase B
MKLVIGCDDAALSLKNIMKDYLKNTRNIEFVDVGIFSEADKELYPRIAEKAVAVIRDQNNEIEYGILLCGTGIGMALSANKFKGIKAAVCHDVYSAERAKKSNNTNIITMGARVIGPEVAKKMIDIWLDSEFTGGGSTSKVAVIEQFEKENFK